MVADTVEGRKNAERMANSARDSVEAATLITAAAKKSEEHQNYVYRILMGLEDLSGGKYRQNLEKIQAARSNQGSLLSGEYYFSISVPSILGKTLAYF